MKSVLATLSMSSSLAFGSSEWSKQPFRAAFLMGLSFPTRDTGFISGGTNGIGHEVCRSDDAADSWPAAGECGQKAPAAFLMDLEFQPGQADEGVMTGVGLVNVPLQWTDDSGEQWHAAEAVFFGPTDSQDIDFVGGANNTVVATGTFADTAGVAVSEDGGHSYDRVADWSVQASETGHPRYGAFPTPDVWYISGGRWPSDEAESNVQRITEHISVDLDTGRASVDHHLVAASEDNNYVGVIQKTTDGGRTWSNSFYEVGGLYFNHIECPLRDTCWVVGEGSSHAAVLSTNDGGETWETQLEFDDGTSLMAAKCINERTCWIAGGRLSLVDFRASVWFTQDAGQTWTRDDSPAWEDAYVTNLDFVDQEHGFATAFHKSTAFTEIFAYRPPQA